MIVRTITTPKITSKSISLLELLDQVVPKLEDGSVIAITSKIVSLCEGSTVPLDQITKDELLVQESDLYLPPQVSKYGHHFTIVNNTLIAMAGIDESNGDGHYVLWPKDSQSTANAVRKYLKSRFNLERIGVIITDSTSRPMRRGASGITLAHSGFAAVNSYVGTPDIFGRPFGAAHADIAGGLAAAAVLQMGEGTEQTPIAILSDLPFIAFQDRDPNEQELAEAYISLEDDLFAPFLTAVEWNRGARN